MAKKHTASDTQSLLRKIYQHETGKPYQYGTITQADKHAMQNKYKFSKVGNKHVAELKEDAVPVNAAGAGGIAGIGTGPYPQSEPGVPKKKALRVILNKAKMLTRTK